MKCEHQEVCQLKNTGRGEDCDCDRNDCRYFQTPFSPLSVPDRWRDVREELPNVAGCYIVFTVTGTTKKIAWAFFNSDKRWVVDSRFFDSVTHWKPLPPPPSGKGGE